VSSDELGSDAAGAPRLVRVGSWGHPRGPAPLLARTCGPKMMIRISDPELMPALVAHLRQSEFAVEVLDAQTLEAHLPGVDPAQAERELRLYLDVWRVLHPDSQIELERKTRR
jgi:hypothetical protein